MKWHLVEVKAEEQVPCYPDNLRSTRCDLTLAVREIRLWTPPLDEDRSRRCSTCISLVRESGKNYVWMTGNENE